MHSTASISIRNELPSDDDAVRNVLVSAFGSAAEADLVDQLKADGDVMVSLVATDQKTVVGHILFSPLAISGPASSLNVVSLAPVAVLPAWQRRGIGSLLVRDGIQACAGAGIDAIIVIGDPEYYGRFGFSAGITANLKSPYSGPAFMALELKPEALDIGEAAVSYPAAFSHLP